MNNFTVAAIATALLAVFFATLSIDFDQTEKNIAKYKKCQEAGMVMLQSMGGGFECYPPSALEQTEPKP